MKKITIFFTGLALMWMAAACSLDERILDTPGPVQVTSDQELLPLINGLYSRFNDANAFKFRGWLMLTLCADDFYSVAANEFQPFANRTYGGGECLSFLQQPIPCCGRGQSADRDIGQGGGQADTRACKPCVW